VSALLRAVDAAAITSSGPADGARAPASPARLEPAALPDDELLALVLGGAGARAAARAILDEVGIAGLAQLCVSDGRPLGRTRTVRLLAAAELGRRVAGAWPPPGWRIRSPADLAERLLPAMGHLEREELRSVLLNTKNVVTGMVIVYAGNLAGSSVRIGEVFRDAVRRQAASMVVVHNHPSGDPSPSAEDLRITRELAEAGRLLDIDLLDHLVIGHGRWVSLRALGAL